MQAGCNAVAAALHAKLGPGKAAAARGMLWAIPDPAGWYPALLPDEGGAPVRGMLHETGPAFSAQDLATLDAYEGAEYGRLEIPVEDGGLVFLAHAWVWSGPVPAGAEPIPDGDFAAFVARRRVAVFGSAG